MNSAPTEKLAIEYLTTRFVLGHFNQKQFLKLKKMVREDWK